MSQCGVCELDIVGESAEVLLPCSLCKRKYHKKCLKLTENDLRSATEPWRCTNCTRDRKLSTGSASSKSSAKSSVPSALSAFRKVFDEEQKTMKSFREDLAKKIENLFKQNAEIYTNVASALSEIKEIKAENVVLKERVVVLETRMIERDRIAELNAIEITNIPESITGDVYANASQILTYALNLDITEDAISDCYIVKPSKKAPRNVRDNARKPQGNIWIVRFTTARLRERVMNIVRAKGKEGDWNLRCIGFGDLDFRINIRERVSITARELFGHTKKIATDEGWKYVWMRNGRVHVRKHEKGRVFYINSSADITKLQHESE